MKNKANQPENPTFSNKQFKMSITTIIFLVIAIILLLFSFVAPWLFTKHSIIDFTDTGDTLGSIMNPFIASAGVIATFLAFYMQVRANRLQRELFNEQIKEERARFQQELTEQQLRFDKAAFEHRFYEMLRLHKENVNDMNFITRPILGKSKEINGRRVFRYCIKEIEIIYFIVKNYFPEENKDFLINLAYNYFFHGIGDQDVVFTNKTILDSYDKSIQAIIEINLLQKTAGNISTGFNNIGHHTGNQVRNAPDFRLGYGHSSQLGHYYRHLYQIVKFVAKQNEKFLSYSEKRSSLRTLRAQLSNEEQAMLFYNSKSKIGKKWNNLENKFFTDYRMIHNLDNSLLILDFDLNEEFGLESGSEYRKEENRNDDFLFEFEENKVSKNSTDM